MLVEKDCSVSKYTYSQTQGETCSVSCVVTFDNIFLCIINFESKNS